MYFHKAQVKQMIDKGWRISEPYSFETKKEEREIIVKELLSGPRPPKREVPKTFNGKPLNELSKKEWDDFIFSMQTPAMQAAILEQKKRNPEDDLEWILRPISACLANPEAKNQDELVKKRNVGIEEFSLVEGMRRSQKNTVGTSTLTTINEDRRNKGVEAFTYSKPANPSTADLKRLKKVEPIQDAIQPIEREEKFSEYKKGFFEKLRLWIDDRFGNWIYK